MPIILSLFLLIGSAPTYDIEAATQRTTDYLQQTVSPVIQKGAEWGVKAGLAVSGINAFLVVVKKFMNVD
ncbi:MAG: hypothetical protein WAN66_14140 [Limnoraphis robusta]|uniref:Uncharacterized protein n=1 Tax=Limnoraphis robusta CS-951 TaxID=1637645 RepID=A0A0F5YJ47_9CYAN|nr:hypothetical protein [Limnoraphis robusta]KKD38783.1 hypothetical protein WN50_06985 [Limnoraphis robusta CS-951]